jgi:hypothetical protein
MWVICLFSTTFVYGQKEVEIEGFVVDENNKPVQGARISWFYESSENQLDSLTSSFSSLEDGYFGFTADWKLGKKIRILIEDSRISKLYSPIDISNSKLKDFPQFKGIIISNYRSHISLGEIKNYIRYGEVNIDLQNTSRSFIQKIKKRLIYLKVKDVNGNIISDGTINPAYSEATKELKFCLPEGVWSLELYDDVNITHLQPRQVSINSQSLPVLIDIPESTDKKR